MSDSLDSCPHLGISQQCVYTFRTLGFRVDAVTHDEFSVPTVHSSMEVTPAHLAPNGFCHAASIIALADSACGAGTYMTLPAGKVNFTTATLMSSHVGTATSGRVTCSAVGTHLGRTTQVWDATVNDPKGKRIAMLRVTQILLHPNQ